MTQFLNVKTGIAGVVLIPVLFLGWTMIAPGYVSRGIVTDAKLELMGLTYVAYVACDGEEKPGVIRQMATLGKNQYRVRGRDRADAEAAIVKAFPDCKIDHVRSEGIPGWRRMLSSATSGRV